MNKENADKIISINFSPNDQVFEEVLDWTSFPSSNWQEINRCFESKCLAVAMMGDKPIAFIAYKYSSVSIFISIAETHPDCRNQGIGKLLVSSICERYADSIYKALFLRCAPVESQYAWEKIGFIHYPKRARENRNEVYMYLIFGDVCRINSTEGKMEDLENVIEIFDTELPKDNTIAKWYAEIDFCAGTNKLKKPFLFFGNENWQIRIKKDGVERVRDRYKKYDMQSEVYGCFYIDELKK